MIGKFFFFFKCPIKYTIENEFNKKWGPSILEKIRYTHIEGAMFIDLNISNQSNGSISIDIQSVKMI